MKNELVKARNSSPDIVLGDKLPKMADIPKPPTSAKSLIGWLLVTGLGVFGGLGFWAATSELNSAVVANGQFEVTGDLRTVQHLSGGIVTEIAVRDGEKVAEGDVIAKLDTTRSDAQRALLRNQLASTLARQARLRAEFLGEDTIKISEELQGFLKSNPETKEALAAQQALFDSNRQMDAGQVAILDNMIEQLQEQRVGVSLRLKAQENQLDLTQQELADLQELFESGLTTRNRLLTRRRAETQLIGDIGESQSELLYIDEQIAEYSERRLQVERDRKIEIADALQVLQELVADVRHRLGAADLLADQLTIRAPISGHIVGFELNTLGGVIQPGESLMRIVPDNSDFLVRARVFPGDIDEVQVGADVRIRLSAYSYRKTPPIEGVITQVSADVVLDEVSGERFYEVVAEIPEEAYAAAPEVAPVPSMPAQLFISTGHQTVLTYLLDPVLGGLETAMLENN